MQPAANTLALNVQLLLQIYFYLTRQEIYLTLEYFSGKSKEEKSGSVKQHVGNKSMLTLLSNADYIMVRGVYQRHDFRLFISQPSTTVKCWHCMFLQSTYTLNLFISYV